MVESSLEGIALQLPGGEEGTSEGGRRHGRALAGVDAVNLEHSILNMTANRFLGLLYASSIGWVGIWMPCKVLAWLWRLWPVAGIWEEIIPLCFLIALSVGLLINLIRRLI